MPLRAAPLAGALLLAAAPTLASGQASPRHDALVGIWASETTFGPALAGELTVRRVGDEWRATIMSIETRAPAARDSVRLTFGALGELRGRLVDDGRTIRGFWIQPSGVVIGYPFATPLTLVRAQRTTWRGTVSPLPDRYSLYLSVQRAAGGALVGVFRNPELNDLARVSQFRITRVGDSIVFAAGLDTLHPTVRVAGTFDSLSPTTRQLSLRSSSLGRIITLVPVPDSQAVGLFPRLPYRGTYAYAPPIAERDGWKTARASDVGMDERRLASLVQRIADTVPTLVRVPLVHSLLVARHGRLVLEEYFYGHDRDRPHDIRSAGKTFASVMLGAAMMRGVKIAPETPLAPLLDGAPFANPDPRKTRITLAHLMTHSSGLACDDNDDDSPGNEGTMQGQTAQPDYWKYMMDLPMTHDPGAYYAYCSGSMNLMSAALTRATGTWLPAYFDETVARPLQFGRYHFNLTPTRQGYLGGGAFLRPRDLLKVGQLYLDGGVWNGARIVPRAWVEQSITPKISWPSRGENVSAGTDGYAWHLNTIRTAGRDYREYEANGNGGQLLMVVPELDLVVVFTAGNYMFGGVWSRFRNDFLPNAIIPAIQW
jgi:CubicO group peptidase (beta-lactamase class C family)